MAGFIDTDIGSDVDDTLAILYASKHLNVAGITTVHACSGKRANIVKNIFQELGRDISVHAGIDKPLVSEKLYQYGYEGNGILKGNEPEQQHDAVDFLAKSITPQDVLFCIAPLTNIATLLQQHPIVKEKVKRIYVMGGIIEQEDKYLPNMEKHNFKVDPESASIVFSSGIQLTVLPTEIAKQVWLTKEDFKKMPQTRLFDYVRINAQDYCSARDQEITYLYDPLTMMMFIKPELFTTRTKGYITVATSVKVGEAKQELIKTLEGLI